MKGSGLQKFRKSEEGVSSGPLNPKNDLVEFILFRDNEFRAQVLVLVSLQLFLFLQSAESYGIFRADLDAHPTSPAEGVIRHYLPILAELAFFPCFWEGDENGCGTIFQTFSALQGSITLFLIYPNLHRPLRNR
jgi:hypothetical protein